MSNQQLNRQYSYETLSNLSHTKKLLDPASYRNYLNQQQSIHKHQKTHSTFQKSGVSGVSGGFEDINFNVSPLDVPRQPVFKDLNYITRNFGNQCDRVFRDQTKSSQKQKFGVRDKEQALKNLAAQQENLRKLKQAKSSNIGDQTKQRPIKDAGLDDKRGFFKKVFEFNDMKMVVMFKSIEVEAVQKGQNEISKGKKRISQLIFFEDLKYLVENFSLDEISDLFKKCIFVQNNKIQIDYQKFASLPSKKPTGSILDKHSSFPQQQDYTQEDSSLNKENDNGYRGKYVIKVQFPIIEMYISEFAHKQIYYTKKKDILDLFKSKFESLKDYVIKFYFQLFQQRKFLFQKLRHFDSSKLNKSKADFQPQARQKKKSEEPIVEDLTISKVASNKPKTDLNKQNEQKPFSQEDQTYQKGRLQKQESNKSEKNKKNEEVEQLASKPLNLQIDKQGSDEDQKLKQFQESLNERLKTISEQQQTQQDDDEEQEQLINAIQEREKSVNSQSSSKNYDENFEKQKDNESSVKHLQQNGHNQRFDSKESEQILRQKSESQQKEASYEQNSQQQDFEEISINQQREENEEKEKIAPPGTVEDVYQSEQVAVRSKLQKEEYLYESEQQFEQKKELQGQDDEQFEGQEGQQFEQYEEEQFEGQDGEEFQGQNEQQYQQEEYQQEEGEEYQGQEQEQEQYGQDSQQYEGSEQYEGQDGGEQYEGQDGGEQYEGQDGGEQYEGQEDEEQYQEEGSNQEGQEMDIPQFSIEESEREFDPAILMENVILQGVVWNDSNYIIGFKSLDVNIESNGFEGKIVKQLSFLELYTLLLETRESIVGEYLMEKIAISENMEVALDLPQIDFDFQECQSLEEGYFYKFIDELNDFEINMEDQAFLISFNKPSIEISDEQGMNTKQMEVDGGSLQSIVQRGFHFDFIVAQ